MDRLCFCQQSICPLNPSDEAVSVPIGPAVADYSEYRFPGLMARLKAACCRCCENRLTGLVAPLKAVSKRCCECRLPRLGAAYKWLRDKLKTLMFLGTAFKGL